jgi:hypothetical protein
MVSLMGAEGEAAAEAEPDAAAGLPAGELAAAL